MQLEFEGIWKTLGYGYIFEIIGNELNAYEISDISCLKLKQFDSNIKFPYDLDIENKPFSLTITDENIMIFEMKGETLRYYAKKIEKLPEICATYKEFKTKDPIRNFKVFWQTFNEHYAFFKERGIDWQSIYNRFYPKISADTTDKELFLILTKIMARLKDMHVTLTTNEQKWLNFRLLPRWLNLRYMEETLEKEDALTEKEKLMGGKRAEIYEKVGYRDFVPMIKKNYLKDNVKTECNGMIFYGKINNSIGYVFVHRESYYISDVDEKNNPVQAVALLNETLDKIVEELKNTDSMILDLRFNLGGNDRLSLTIVERFADRKRCVIAKQAIDGDTLSPLWKLYVDPENKRSFSQKKVFVLTSGLTLSSGEVQTIAMSALPHVTVIGEPTMGNLSDTLLRHLPNGWTFTLSNEMFYSHNMTLYEAIKFQPDILIKMDLEGFKKGRDNILDKALELANE